MSAIGWRIKPARRSTDGNTWLVQQAIERAKAGDSEGLHFLYVRYAPDVQRYIASFVRDHHEAEDITQNVFAKLMKAIQKYEQRDVPFAAWIMRVSRNAALDHMRSRRATPAEEVRVTDDGHAQTSTELSHDLRQALEQLPGDQREVLILRHIAGLSPLEIATTLKKSESVGPRSASSRPPHPAGEADRARCRASRRPARILSTASSSSGS